MAELYYSANSQDVVRLSNGTKYNRPKHIQNNLVDRRVVFQKQWWKDFI